MRRGELVSVCCGSFLLLAAAVLIAARSLPVMSISSVRVSGIPMTPSVARLTSPALGTFYPAVERREIREGIEALPYVGKAMLSYEKNALVVEAAMDRGLVLISSENASFYDGKELFPITLEDAGALSGTCAMVSVPDAGNITQSMAEMLSALVATELDPNLITWIEYCNNIGSGEEPAELRIALPELNASVILTEPAAVDRLDETIGIIEAENRRNPGRTVFSPPLEYELCGDSLTRLKG